MKKTVVERKLEESELTAMADVAAKARAKLGITKAAKPEAIIAKIGAFIDSVRKKKRVAPRDGDTRLGLGVLWGEQLRARTKWEWVHLTFPDGFKSYALVPKDRHCACFPLNDIPDQMSVKKKYESTSILLFNMVVAGRTPDTKKKSYTPFG